MFFLCALALMGTEDQLIQARSKGEVWARLGFWGRLDLRVSLPLHAFGLLMFHDVRAFQSRLAFAPRPHPTQAENSRGYVFAGHTGTCRRCTSLPPSLSGMAECFNDPSSAIEPDRPSAADHLGVGLPSQSIIGHFARVSVSSKLID